MTQLPMTYSGPTSPLGFDPLVSCAIAGATTCGAPRHASPASFLDNLLDAANHISRFEGPASFALVPEKPMARPANANYVLRRDLAGRPALWRIGGMVRKIVYLPNGKIKTMEDTGKLSPLATANGERVYLLGFETYDGGKTYIGRLMVNEETDSIVMTDLYIRNEGTVVATDDSGFEMTWNPNNGDTSTEFVQHNHLRESWTDHLDGTVTIEMSFENGTAVRMKGICEQEFFASNIQIKSNGGRFELQSSGPDKVCRTLCDPSGSSEIKIISRDIKQIGRSLMEATSVAIAWQKTADETPLAVVVCLEDNLLDCMNQDL